MENSNQPLCKPQHNERSAKSKRKVEASDDRERRRRIRQATHDWLMALTADPQVPSSAVRVAVVIAHFVNSGTGEAWASQKTVAKRAGIAERSARWNIKLLQDLGWLDVLSGRERTDPKSNRGVHYRPARPDCDRDADRGTDRETAGSAPVLTGNMLPVRKDGEATSKRQDMASKPATCGRQTGNMLPVSYNHEKTFEESEPRSRAVPNQDQGTSIESESSDAPCGARPPLPGEAGEEGSHHPAGQKDSRQGRDDVYDDIPPPEDPFAGWEPLEPPPSFDDVYDLDSGGTEDLSDEEYARQLLDDFGTLPDVVDSNDWRQVLAFDDGFTAAVSKREREIPDQFRMSKQLARAWLAGFNDFAVREAEGRVPDNFIAF